MDQKKSGFTAHLTGLSLLIFLGIVVKVVFLVYLAHTQGGYGVLTQTDEKRYLSAANLILQSGLGFFATPRSLWDAPLFPLLIAMCGLNILVVKVFNIVLLSIVGVLVWDAARRLFSLRAAFGALFLCTFYPPLIELSCQILTEPLFTFFLTASFWCLTTARAHARSGFIYSGLFMGAAALTRATAQLFPLFLMGSAVVLHVFASGRPAKKGAAIFRDLLWFFCGACAVICPYVLKNSVLLDKAGVSNGLGAVLYLGNDLRKDGDEPVYRGMHFDTFQITKPYHHLDSEGDRRLTAAALEMISLRPFDCVRLTLRKIGRYLFGYHSYYFYPVNTFAAMLGTDDLGTNTRMLIQMVLLVSVAVSGIVGLTVCRVPRHVRYFAGSLVVYLTLLHAIAFPIPRLAVPMFPMLTVFAAGCWEEIRTGERRRGLLAVVAGSVIALLLIISIVPFRSEGTVSHTYRGFFQKTTEISPQSPMTMHDVTGVDPGVFRADGGDPYVVYRIEPLKLQKNQVLFIEMTARMSEDPPACDAAQIFWGDSSRNDEFSEARTSQFQLLCDGRSHIYFLSLSLLPGWAGSSGLLRLDFPERSPGAEYRLAGLTIGH